MGEVVVLNRSLLSLLLYNHCGYWADAQGVQIYACGCGRQFLDTGGETAQTQWSEHIVDAIYPH